MKLWLRLLLIAVTIFGVVSFTWFLLSYTAYFQRGMDIIGAVYLWGAGVPVILLNIFFTILLIKKWTPEGKEDYFGICVWLLISTLLSASLIQK